MESTQENTSATMISPTKDVGGLQKNPSGVSSQDLWHKAVKLSEAGLYAAGWYMGVPAPLLPLIKCSLDLSISIVNDPAVQRSVSQIGSQIGSTTKDAYFWTARTASSAKDKTTQAVSSTYNYTIEKTSQGINYSRDLITWKKNNINFDSTPKKQLSSSYGIITFGNSYRRSLAISSPDNGAQQS